MSNVNIEIYMRHLTDKANKIWTNQGHDGAVICLCIYAKNDLANVSLELMDAKRPIREVAEVYHGKVFTDVTLYFALKQLEEFINTHYEKFRYDKFMKAVKNIYFSSVRSDNDKEIIEFELREYFKNHEEI